MKEFPSEKKILIETIEKLIILREIKEWQSQIIPLAPPVLWFGDSKSIKPKVLTLGANPSRKEFLSDNKKKAIEKLRTENSFNYLLSNERRFFHFEKESDLDLTLVDIRLQDEIINSYNKYFETKPYNWFGKRSQDSQNSYNVEGFLNGLDSSYYGQNSNQALHIDLLPYATLDDFNKISKLCVNDIFSDKWGKDILLNLIQFINPKCLIIFGRANLHYFSKLFSVEIGKQKIFETQKVNGKFAKCSYWIFNFLGLPTIGLSVNLGNPKGFNSESLLLLGERMYKELGI